MVGMGEIAGVKVVAMSQLQKPPKLPYPDSFPNLNRLGWLQTSQPAFYNCIAFAAGDTKRWWWPGNHPPNTFYWPVAGAVEPSLANFYAAFATIGYLQCDNGVHVPGFEKVAFYMANGLVTHAAIQQLDGTWKSKLGKAEDISHTLAGLEGPSYGVVAAFVSRPIPVV